MSSMRVMWARPSWSMELTLWLEVVSISSMSLSVNASRKIIVKTLSTNTRQPVINTDYRV